MAFGGKSWSINPADMNLGTISQDDRMCAGGIFDLTAGTSIQPGSGTPSWIIGDTFLVRSFNTSLHLKRLSSMQKNVYTVFRTNPDSVGFAQLSTQAGGSPSPSSSISLGTLKFLLLVP